jgi:hypothetical protein
MGGYRRWLVLALKVGALAVAFVVITRLIRRVDWSEVGDALGQLEFWQIAALLGVVAIRQVVNSLPLALFTPNLPVRRAVANDLVGNLVATVAPAPSDIVARMSLFRRWGVDVSRGMAGLVLNSLFFYIVRLAAPMLGFLLLWATYEYDGVFATAAITGGIGAVAIAVGLVIGMSSRDSAAKLGRFLGRTLHRIRDSWPDEQAMQTRLVEFHANVSARLIKNWYWAAGAVLLQVLIESLIMLMALRFVDVSPTEVPGAIIIACFLLIYPMTALPFLGLGVLDATFIAVVADRSAAYGPELVAGVIVWRVCVQLLPLIAGGVTLLWTQIRGRGLADAAQVDSPTPPASGG